jgi:hypothetical protein
VRAWAGLSTITNLCATECYFLVSSSRNPAV